MDKKIEKIKKMYIKENKTTYEIAEKLGCSQSYISRLIRQSDEISPRKSGPEPFKIPKKLLKKLYCKEKKSLNEISKELNISKSTVLKNLKKHNIKTRPKHQDKFEISKKKIKNLYINKKKTIYEIAEKYNRSNSTIREKLEEYGIPRRDSQYKSGENHPNWKGGIDDSIDYGKKWDIQREKALERDNYKCVVCGRKNKDLKHHLNIHHIKPFRKTQNNNLSNLVTLCPKHHSELEHIDSNKVSNYKEFIKFVKNNY